MGLVFKALRHDDINRREWRHSRESGNPEKIWIPGQARNDKLHKTYAVIHTFILNSVWKV